MVVQKEFLDRAHRIVWCTVATVGPDNRPRTRILHPIWELYDELTGWIVTRATPVKVRHLTHSSYVSCSYWEPGHEVAVADCEAEWVTDAATRQRVWELYRDAPAPLGYDFWSVFPDGPSGESPSLLRLTPYRLRLADVETLSGRKVPLAWP
ncbi:pyridoxamine 5'-phosphate oxidase family protein [Kribbella soli]|uniref:Pyridoxamine 5'-phosphate oxidase n=1 Tax=Kribbella soli TaxID=1124743 RepID=A0A4R0H683_9ACTN|nr:pyridoxamine 5'-phosphate oxidase family protein [Kribbella soli]TCC05413.1 pyridoxamine 5'-phosphate oxidase [Kribbella soli]